MRRHNRVLQVLPVCLADFAKALVYLHARLHRCSCTIVPKGTRVPIACIQVATAVNTEQLKLCNTHQQRAKFALEYLSNSKEF